MGELPDLWDFVRRRLGGRLAHLAVRHRGLPGAVCTRPEGADQQAGRRRRLVHVAGHDGADDHQRHSGPDRGRPAVDRRSVPSRARSRRAGSRISASASAATSASPATRRWSPIRCTQNPSMGEEWRRGWHPGADPPIRERVQGADRRCRPGRAGGRAGPGQARLRGRAGRGNGRRWAAEWRRRPGCPAWPPGSAWSTTAAPSSSASPRSSSPSTARSTPRRCCPTGSTTSASRPAPAGAATGSAAGITQPLPDRRRHAGAHARRPDGRRATPRQAGGALRRRPLLHGRCPCRAARPRRAAT